MRHFLDITDLSIDELVEVLALFGGKLLRRKSQKNHSLVGTDERLPSA